VKKLTFMNVHLTVSALLFLLTVSVRTQQQEPTPLSAPLPDATATTIYCVQEKEEALAGLPSTFPRAAADVYRYRLYLPPNYSTEPERHYPAMFIVNGDLAQMKVRAKRDGWIVIMLPDAKNGPWPPILGNLFAAHDDAAKRLRLKSGWKFSTGFSGGARAASLLAQFRSGFGGVLLQGAGFAFDECNDYITGPLKSRPADFNVFMAVGDRDTHSDELEKLRRELRPVNLRYATFLGGHQRATQALFDEGVDWLLSQLQPADGGKTTTEKN
jgi:hypothetical protein